MAEMNLDRLETLLETMEPHDIRQQYTDELAACPQSEAMLASFEGLDDDLTDLKRVEPPPPFRKPGKSYRVLQAQWILPLAACVLLAVFWGSNMLRDQQVFDGEIKGETAVHEDAAPSQAPMESADDSEADLEEVEEGLALMAPEQPPAEKDQVDIQETTPKLEAGKKQKSKMVAIQKERQKNKDQAEAKPLVENELIVVQPAKKQTFEPEPVVAQSLAIDAPLEKQVAEEAAATSVSFIEEIPSPQVEAPRLEPTLDLADDFTSGEDSGAGRSSGSRAAERDEPGLLKRLMRGSSEKRKASKVAQSDAARDRDEPSELQKVEALSDSSQPTTPDLLLSDPYLSWLRSYESWRTGARVDHLFTQNARVIWPGPVRQEANLSISQRQDLPRLSYLQVNPNGSGYLLKWIDQEGKSGQMILILNAQGHCTSLIPGP